MSRTHSFIKYIGMPVALAADVYSSIEYNGFREGIKHGIGEAIGFAGRVINVVKDSSKELQNFAAPLVTSLAERSASLYNSTFSFLIGHSGTCPLPYSQAASAAQCATNAAPGVLVRGYQTVSAMFWGTLSNAGIGASNASTAGNVIHCTNELCIAKPGVVWTTVGECLGYIHSGIQSVYSSLPSYNQATTFVNNGLESLCSTRLGTTVSDTLSHIVTVDINWGAASFQFGRLLNAINLSSPVLTPLIELGFASIVRSYYSSRQDSENKALKDRLIEETDPTVKKEEATKQKKKLEESTKYYKKLADRSIISFSGILKCALTVAPAAFLVPQVGVPVAAALAVGGLVTRFGTHFLEASRNRSMEQKMQAQADSFKKIASDAEGVEKLIAENERLKNVGSRAAKRNRQLAKQRKAGHKLHTQKTQLVTDLAKAKQDEEFAWALINEGDRHHKEQLKAVNKLKDALVQDAEEKANQKNEELLEMIAELELKNQNLQKEVDTYHQKKAVQIETSKRKEHQRTSKKQGRKLDIVPIPVRQQPHQLDSRISKKSAPQSNSSSPSASGYSTPMVEVASELNKVELKDKLQQVANTQQPKAENLDNDQEAVIPAEKDPVEPLTSVKSSYLIDEGDDEGISMPFPFNLFIPSSGREQYES